MLRNENLLYNFSAGKGIELIFSPITGKYGNST